MSETIQLRQQNPDETDKMAQYQSPDGDAVCASYVSQAVAENIGEFAQVTVSDGDNPNVELDNISGSGSGNYAVYEHPGGGITGFYLSHDVWAEVTGEDIERDGDDNIQNAPSTLQFEFAASSEEAWDDANTVTEEDVSDLLASGDSDESDESESDEVEISDDELDLVADD